MNKKFNRYTGLFILAIVFSVVFSVFNPEDSSLLHFDVGGSHCHLNNDDYKMKVVEDTTMASSTQYNLSYEVTLRRCSPVCKRSTIIIENGSTKGEMVVKKATLNFAMDEIPVWQIVAASIAVLIGLTGIIWMVVLMWRTVRNIHKGNIFVSQMIKDIEKLGIIMVIFFIAEFIMQIVTYMYACSHFHFEGYQIAFGETGDKVLLLVGTGLMVLSQVIGMGKDIQEENDLTI